MTPDQWQEAKELFEAALERPAEDRAAFLGSRSTDESTRRRVEELLAEHDAAGSFMSTPPFRPSTPPAPARVSEPWRAGDQVSHYKIAGKAGSGGMGVVYQAWDVRLNRDVALKVLAPEHVSSPERKRRFEQEARAASALNHPNIVHVYDISDWNGTNFIVMEFVEGLSLDNLIKRRPLSVDLALKYAVQIADGASRAHSSGIVHRDLKPSNILVTEDGVVKIVDFGLAKLLERDHVADPGVDTQEGVIAGTLPYMSPEQIEGNRADARSDIFSFGALFYEMLTGHRAFPGDSNVSILSSICHQDPKPLREYRRGIAPELERIVARCLRKDPQRRVQTMADLRVQLEEVRDAAAAGPAQPETASKAPPRRAFVYGFALASLLISAAAMVYWLAHSPQPPLGPVLTRMTFDPGLTTDPALSADGKFLAYASDRAAGKNLDIWVQQLGGGPAVRLTQDDVDDSEPTFSPDGARIAFRSERDDGGIYLVPTLGGQPKLLARRGRSPHFSPDGSQVLYFEGTIASTDQLDTGKIFVVPTAGGEPRQLQPGVAWGCYPIWSPDGESVLFFGTAAPKEPPETRFDWWVIPVDGTGAVRTGGYEFLRRQRFESADKRYGFSGTPKPGAWFSDRIVFSHKLGDSSNLWAIGISPNTFKIGGTPTRLTMGVDAEELPSFASPLRFAFSATNQNPVLWSIPAETNQGRILGSPAPVTSDPAGIADPVANRSGTRLVYRSNRSGHWMFG